MDDQRANLRTVSTRPRPGPGQESVWDYPRPPRVERSARHVVVRLGGTVVAETRRAWRVLETSHPPGWYVPPADVALDLIAPSDARATVCEWKGVATYWDVRADDVVRRGAVWSYEAPVAAFAVIAGAMAFMPAQFACTVDGEPVTSQAGGFYGGWITADVVGPFKGGAGTWGW